MFVKAHDRTPELLSVATPAVTPPRRVLDEKCPPSLLRTRNHGASIPFPLPTMPSESPPPNTSHKVETISAQLQFRAHSTKDTTKGKGKKTLGKLESKNKELSFTFELSEENYLSFLSALLKEHGYEKYTPVKKQHRFGIKVGIGAKKAYVSGYYSHHN